MCGGIGGLECVTGLDCVYENGQTNPPYPDAAGNCTARSFCGGIAAFPCPSGFTCQLDGTFPDAGGHCVPETEVAQEGETCGGLAGIICSNGLVCRYANGQTSPPSPDASGVCVDPHSSACSVSNWTKDNSRFKQWPLWPRTKFSVAFGMNAVSGTLRQVIQRSGQSSTNDFLREAIAALLNAMSSDFNYPFTVNQVIAKVQASYGQRAAENSAYQALKNANNAGNCPL
jgi:hypothetical protein